jgi:hypothetical protein
MGQIAPSSSLPATYPYVVGSRWYVGGRFFPTYDLPFATYPLTLFFQ